MKKIRLFLITVLLSIFSFACFYGLKERATEYNMILEFSTVSKAKEFSNDKAFERLTDKMILIKGTKEDEETFLKDPSIISVTKDNKNALLMALIVLGNITVWFVEKFVPSDFEFLSISYLMSEVFLLFLYWIMEDYVHKDHIEVRKEIKIINAKEIPLEEKKMILSKKVSSFSSLSDRETSIIDLILENKKRKEIASILNLSENTIKTYTRSIFAKLGVSSREDIFDMIYEDHD